MKIKFLDRYLQYSIFIIMTIHTIMKKLYELFPKNIIYVNYI